MNGCFPGFSGVTSSIQKTNELIRCLITLLFDWRGCAKFMLKILVFIQIEVESKTCPVKEISMNEDELRWVLFM